MLLRGERDESAEEGDAEVAEAQAEMLHDTDGGHQGDSCCGCGRGCCRRRSLHFGVSVFVVAVVEKNICPLLVDRFTR